LKYQSVADSLNKNKIVVKPFVLKEILRAPATKQKAEISVVTYWSNHQGSICSATIKS